MKAIGWLLKVASVILVVSLLLSWNTEITKVSASTPSQATQCANAPIPGGGAITFVSDRDGTNEIYVIEGNECQLLKLTDDDSSNNNPVWSPDGTKLLFSSGGYLFTLNADGSSRTRLLNSAPSGSQHSPAWSPDGTRIAFNIGLYEQVIYVVNADGTGLQQLMWSPGYDNYRPSWTPDGTQIVFTSRYNPYNLAKIWIMDADGGNKHRLMAYNNAHDFNAQMSPNGGLIAFQSNRDGNDEIYVMNADGSNQTRLTNNPAYDQLPQWSPDGSKIAFASNRDGNYEIYVMNADGGNQIRITNNPARDDEPFWGGPNLNEPPTVDAGGPYSVSEGISISVLAEGSDPNGDLLAYTWDLDNDGYFEIPGQSVTFSAENLDGPGSRTVEVKVTDPSGLTATDQAVINIQNVAPTVGGITAPLDPVRTGTIISASALFSDAGVLDTHTAQWEWGDGSTSAGTVNETNGSGTAYGTHNYVTPGVYTIVLTVTDKDGGVGISTYQFVVVYDPNGGFVTGGGWIYSPEGAYLAAPSLAGKATFGFVAKYQKGANIPTGNTEFQFKAGDLNFHSDTYDWLVVSGAKAQFKGSGTINGTGTYKFMLTAIDGQLSGGGGIDKFRIKIWWEDGSGVEQVVYDNQPGRPLDATPTSAIQGGSIVIHK